MKKITFLFIILSLLVLAIAAHAEDPLAGIPGENYDQHKSDDGILITWDVGDQYNNVNLNRSNYYFDNNGGNGQSAVLNFRAEAYIPCYIKMVFNGNEGTTSLESFGPGANAIRNEFAYFMAFDNEIGGFVNEDWQSLGHGRNAEVAPGTGVYIQACDVFGVKIYANDNYRYEVISAPLTPVNAVVTSSAADDTLDIQMRTSVDGGAWGSTHSFATAGTYVVGERSACETMQAYHQFRVPYLTSTAHGRYSGIVTFKAYTI